MNSKAQAGLEYLMTYGWALIMIATIIGVLIFTVATPAVETQFSSSEPNKILLKSSAVDTAAIKAQAVLQNITGGQMKITDVAQTGTLSGCTIDATGTISAGQSMLLECTYNGTPQGTATITYRDFANLEKKVTINIGGGTAGESTPAIDCTGDCENPDCLGNTACCGNIIKESIETCDKAIATGMTNVTCNSSCNGFEVTGRATLSKPGKYLQTQDIILTDTDDGIRVDSSNVEFDCDRHLIEYSGIVGDVGIRFDTRSNIIAKNCIIKNASGGIFSSGGSGTNLTVTGNTITGPYAGIDFFNVDGYHIANNVINTGVVGIFVGNSNNGTVENNATTVESGDYGGLRFYLVEDTEIKDNTSCGNATNGFWCTGTGNTGMGNVAKNISNACAGVTVTNTCT